MESIIRFLILLFLSFNVYALDLTHKKWDKILKDYTKREKSQVLVNYKELNKTKATLDLYLNDLESFSKIDFDKLSKNDQLAFWINAYNAYTFKLILDNYPVKSIKKIGSFFTKPWSIKFIPLFGEKMTLDEIEHETIRKQFKEPRIHFAVNCASIGCPSLLREAFVGEKLDKQLHMATELFINNKDKNYIKGDTLYVSKIFDWYEVDFGDSEKGVIKFFSNYIDVSKVKEVDHLKYDWNLNSY